MARLKPDSKIPKTPTYHRVSRSRTLLNTVFSQVDRQNVTFAAPRMDQRRGEAFVNLLSPPPDIHVGDVLKGVEGFIPDRLRHLHPPPRPARPPATKIQ